MKMRFSVKSVGVGLLMMGMSSVTWSQAPAASSGRSEALFPLCRTAKMCGYMDQTGKRYL
jgi:hypothetical protein